MQFFFQELYSHIDKNSGKSLRICFLSKLQVREPPLKDSEMVTIWQCFLICHINDFRVFLRKIKRSAEEGKRADTYAADLHSIIGLENTLRNYQIDPLTIGNFYRYKFL